MQVAEGLLNTKKLRKKKVVIRKDKTCENKYACKSVHGALFYS